VRVAVIFDNFGPYHVARLAAAAQRCDLLAIEVNESSRDYPWARPARVLRLNEVTLFQSRDASEPRAPALRMRLADAIASHRSEVVFVPGWASMTSVMSLDQCLKSRIPAVVMSDSQAIDGPRSIFREGIKRRIVGLFSAGLVGGRPHAKYLADLGMPSSAILQGYDAVDNQYFAAATESARQRSTLDSHGQGGYFLTVSRFVEKKNLPMLLASFADYRQAMIDRRTEPYSLMLLGDGPMRVDLERLRSTLGLDQAVLMPGFVQYDKLPGYMAGARALIHASTVEQWACRE
jgi:1,2-diacylglycerol 3-alpha-glucosyltransferase